MEIATLVIIAVILLINIIVLASGDYINYREGYYNKLVLSLKEKKVIR